MGLGIRSEAAVWGVAPRLLWDEVGGVMLAEAWAKLAERGERVLGSVLTVIWGRFPLPVRRWPRTEPLALLPVPAVDADPIDIGCGDGMAEY